MQKSNIRTNSVVFVLLFILVTFCLAVPAFAQDNKASNVVRAPSGFPSLVSSVRLDKEMDFCGEVVPLDIPNVRERLEKELLLNLWNRAQILLYLKRAGKYFPYMEAQLKARNMPDDLKYLAVIESALKPHAGSNRGAVGYWQFIRATGKRYGLRVDGSIDERRNLFTSTRAALEYLSDLHKMFDSWSLAAAGYNMGEQGLKKRIRAQGVSEYHLLHLPRETQAYVFRAIAVKHIMSAPSKFGFHMTSGDYWEQPEFERVKAACKYAVPVKAVADAARTHLKAIKDLNPQLLSSNLPAGTHRLLVPKGGGEGFEDRFAKLVAKSKPTAPTVYVVRKGDNLSTIAKKLRVPLNALLKRNKLSKKSNIHPGQRLKIPR